ncbi:TetR/AcrR family transcriptional regulator [Polyangium sp. 6x1]|uniref:TetR/AcrR family transcriptional regulator n=1 Tax=Polyangium sp. 6x1 TaxID=3042689 RepID=UPI0024826F10|nr:TetR/AcrR family transcriptional regulator [Polyangium sp. 6x1]MDI1446179.1 helix-turn-helix domain-containing protein [Polyangium sp. 6x1]
MKAARQKRSEDTVRFILEATDRILAREGPTAVTTKRVAREAGVGVGTVYHHFADRVALLREAERRAWEAEYAVLLGRLTEIDPAQIDPETVEMVASHLIGFTVERVLQRVDRHGISMDDADMRTVMAERYEHTADFLARTLAVVAPRFRRPDLRTSLLIATETLALMSWAAAHRHRDRVKSGEFQRELSDMILRYLLADKDER